MGRIRQPAGGGTEDTPAKLKGNAMHAVRTQCEVLDVGQYSDPTFGPF